MPIDEDGFLCESLSEVRNVVRMKYAEHYSLLRQTNRLAVSQQHALLIHVDSTLERYAACVFARTIATVQASVHLLENGLVSQTRMLLRSALETLFTLGAISVDSGVVDRLVEGHTAEQRRAAKNMQLWRHPELAQIANAEIVSGDLQTFLDSTVTALSTFDLAQKAGLEEWYRTVYMIFSWSVHGAAVDLEHHVVVGPNGDVSEFRNEPEMNDQESTWLCCIEILLKSLVFLGKVFPNIDQTMVAQLYEKTHTLYSRSLS